MMPPDAPSPWTDEAIADRFRAEIRRRLEAHNAAFRAQEALELEAVLREHPEVRGQPGYEVSDSGAWSVYQASEVRITGNSVTIVLPAHWEVGVDFVHLFDHTAVGWSRASIGATVVDGQARPTIEIMLVDGWDDQRDAAHLAAGEERRRVLADLYEDDVRTLCSLADASEINAGKEIGDRLRLSLWHLP
jgi:hypothetical protein